MKLNSVAEFLAKLKVGDEFYYIYVFWDGEGFKPTSVSGPCVITCIDVLEWELSKKRPELFVNYKINNNLRKIGVRDLVRKGVFTNEGYAETYLQIMQNRYQRGFDRSNESIRREMNEILAEDSAVTFNNWLDKIV